MLNFNTKDQTIDLIRGEWTCRINYSLNTSGGKSFNKLFVTMDVVRGETFQMIIERNANDARNKIGTCQLADGSLVTLSARMSPKLRETLGDDLEKAAFQLHNIFTDRELKNAA